MKAILWLSLHRDLDWLIASYVNRRETLPPSDSPCKNGI
jgi:hypothetical protein